MGYAGRKGYRGSYYGTYRQKNQLLGGSITEGAGASSPETCYVADMHRLYNLAAARNYGIGGTCIAPQKEVSAEPV